MLLEDFVKEATADYSGNARPRPIRGSGLFTLQLARSFDRVIGVESDPRAARFARQNISANNVTNVEFHNTRVESWLKGLNSTAAPDLILLDPPRTGAAEAIEEIASLKPSRIAYVSCDPATLARDLRKLLTPATAFQTWSRSISSPRPIT